MEEQSNIIQEPKKKSPIVLVIILIIIAFGCIAGGYYLNESGILGNNNTNTQESEKGNKSKSENEPVVTNYEVTDEKVAKLIDGLMHNGGDCQVLKTYANDHKVKVSDIPSEIAYRIAEQEIFNSEKESYTLDEIASIVKKYLGKDYEFNPKDQLGKGECFQYYYDAASKTFIKQQTACGGTCGPMTEYKLVKAVDTDGTLVLDTKVVFAKYDNGTEYDYFSDYEATNGIGTFDDDINTLFDKGSSYKFTFKLEDGNYVFVSSEPAE